MPFADRLWVCVEMSVVYCCCVVRKCACLRQDRLNVSGLCGLSIIPGRAVSDYDDDDVWMVVMRLMKIDGFDSDASEDCCNTTIFLPF